MLRFVKRIRRRCSAELGKGTGYGAGNYRFTEVWKEGDAFMTVTSVNSGFPYVRMVLEYQQQGKAVRGSSDLHAGLRRRLSTEWAVQGRQ